MNEYHFGSRSSIQIQNPFLTAQSTQIKSVISVPIKDFIHHYPRALFNDIPRVGAHFYDIPGSRRTFTTYPGRRSSICYSFFFANEFLHTLDVHHNEHIHVYNADYT